MKVENGQTKEEDIWKGIVGDRIRCDKKKLNGELEIYATLGYISNFKMFHQEASVETIKLNGEYYKNWNTSTTWNQGRHS